MKRCRHWLERLWANRRSGMNFRALNHYVRMLKIGETFVIGLRRYDPSHTQLTDVGRNPPDWRNWLYDMPWWIVKPDRIHTTYVFPDVAYNNTAERLGLYQLRTGYFGSRKLRSVARGLHARCYPYLAPSWFTQGVTWFGTDVYEPIGREIRHPEVQLYDRGLYNMGIRLFRRAYKYALMYQRHGLYDGHDRAYVAHYEYPTGLFAALFRIADHEPLTPAEVNLLPVDMTDMSPDLFRTHWAKFCCAHGIMRVASAGTPLYTEIPLMNYNIAESEIDQLIEA